MAQPFMPFLQVLDANGAPVGGARLYFYVTGTTTAATVYQNVALSSSHAQPVVADGNGRFPAIFLDDAVTYRAVLKNADGSSTLGDVDPVNIVPPAANSDVYAAAAQAAADAAAAADSAAQAAGLTISSINFGTEQSYTIASDAITVTNSNVKLDTEAAAATDNLATINGGTVGQCIVLSTTSSSRDVTVKNGTGNIKLAGSDFVLDTTADMLVLWKKGGQWFELARSNNG